MLKPFPVITFLKAENHETAAKVRHIVDVLILQVLLPLQELECRLCELQARGEDGLDFLWEQEGRTVGKRSELGREQGQQFSHRQAS